MQGTGCDVQAQQAAQPVDVTASGWGVGPPSAGCRSPWGPHPRKQRDRGRHAQEETQAPRAPSGEAHLGGAVLAAESGLEPGARAVSPGEPGACRRPAASQSLHGALTTASAPCEASWEQCLSSYRLNQRQFSLHLVQVTQPRGRAAGPAPAPTRREAPAQLGSHAYGASGQWLPGPSGPTSSHRPALWAALSRPPAGLAPPTQGLPPSVCR